MSRHSEVTAWPEWTDRCPEGRRGVVVEDRLDALPYGTGTPWDWQAAAACRLVDVSVFFPPEAELIGARRLREQQAKAICATCPVIEPCQSHALIRRELYGIWGGLTERERATIWAVTDPQPASDSYPA
jgi:WhiB family transcriptional regulator, redox-sensing transcriptional regulator